jgi:hypothetical protein
MFFEQSTQWLMPVVLATWEVEIRRMIMVQSQPQANSLRDPISKIKKRMVEWLKG